MHKYGLSKTFEIVQEWVFPNTQWLIVSTAASAKFMFTIHDMKGGFGI